MKRGMSLVLAFVLIGCACVACGSDAGNENVSVTKEKTEKSVKQLADKAQYKLSDDTLQVSGGYTMELDELWQILRREKVRFLSVSSDVKYVLPLSKEMKEEKSQSFCYIERATLEGNPLTFEALSCLLREFRFCKILFNDARSGEEKTYDVSPIGRHEPFYKEYLENMQVQDGMYISSGILFSYEGKDKSIVIPETVSEIADEAFLGEKMDVELESVVFSDSVESIGERAFAAQKLRKVILGEQTREIGAKAFGDCELEQILRIPAAVESIGEEAFGVVKEVVFEGKTTNYSREMCKPGEETRYSFEQGVAESFTNIWASSFVDRDEENNRVTISVSWVPVGNVDGYDVCVNAGCDYDGRISDDYARVVEVSPEKSYAEVTVPAPEAYLYSDVGIKIKPYKKEKDYKVYGDSVKCMCGDQDEEEEEGEDWRYYWDP